MIILAFDTATDVATSALLVDGELRAERTSVPRTLLEDIDALLRAAGVEPGADRGSVIFFRGHMQIHE